MRRFFWLCLLACLCLTQTALAHTRSQSFSTWEVDGPNADFVFAVDALRITQLGPLYPDQSDFSSLLKIHLEETISAAQNGADCAVELTALPNTRRDVYRMSGQVSCPEDILQNTAEVHISSFFGVSPTHIHIARLSVALGGGDIVLRAGTDQFELKDGETPQSLWGFISVGFHHVLSGLDHILFLIGLALAARKPRLAIFCITGFTLGHTASLGLATYGLIQPDSRLVEALIGFTIALMALEAAAPGDSRKRAFMSFAAISFLIVIAPISGGGSLWLAAALGVYVMASGMMDEVTAKRILPVLTIAFGLIHGAGFAGGLQELSLSQANLAWPLIGFNIGVELAQLLALGIVYIAMFILAKKLPALQKPVEGLTALIIFGLGCFWFAERLWV